MTNPVDPNTASAQAQATASIDRTQSGTTSDQDGTAVHIGGGLYLSAGHVFYQYVNPGAPRSADDYRLTTGDSLTGAYSVTATGPDFSATFTNYGWGSDGGSDVASVLTPDTTAVQIPMIVYADPNEAAGTLTTYGFPVDGGYDGTQMVVETGTLTTNSHTTVPTGNGDATVLISDIGMQVYSGQSGSGVWLTNDIDGDGQQETYLAGIVSLDVQYVGGLHATGFEPMGDVYAALGTTIETAGLSAGDFARATLVSGQTLASAHTHVTGTVLHEDILGGVNADTLEGGGGNDMIKGGDGGDTLSAGAGRDSLFGGDGADRLIDGTDLDNMTGGAGADTFVMGADNRPDVIHDFQNGIDVINIQAWGAVDMPDLTITDHHSGRVFVRYQRETLVIDDGARALSASDLDATDFVFAAGSSQQTVTGTSNADKLIGTDADERFEDGAGVDRLYGRAGADTFALSADAQDDWIKDWQDGIDTIDVSAWGAASFDALTVTQHGNGRVKIAHGDETLYVDDAPRTLIAASVTADDFQFA